MGGLPASLSPAGWLLGSAPVLGFHQLLLLFLKIHSPHSNCSFWYSQSFKTVYKFFEDSLNELYLIFKEVAYRSVAFLYD